MKHSLIMSSITINLDNHQLYPGSKIRGEAICYFRSPKQFKKITISLRGHEHTQWYKRETYYDTIAQENKNSTVHYDGDHDVLLDHRIVFGRGNLPSGEHRFPIDFELPYDIPCSYECAFGRIKYIIQVTVNFIRLRIKASKEVSVLSLIRLQDMPSRMLCPVELSNEETACSFCCAGGNIEMHVKMKKTAFVVGESILIDVYCLNMSKSNVNGLNVKLIQKTQYKATQPRPDYKYDSELVAATLNDGVGANSAKTYNIELAIPSSTVLLNFTRCTLFECRYELKITACISGCHTDLDIDTDVSVGHIPHLDLLETNVSHSQQDACSWVLPVTNQPMPMPGFKIPPYLFAEARTTSDAQAYVPSAPMKEDATSAPPSYEEATTSYLPPKQQI